jgi:hypothetical protein
VTRVALERSKVRAQIAKIEEAIDAAQHVITRNVVVEIE